MRERETSPGQSFRSFFHTYITGDLESLKEERKKARRAVCQKTNTSRAAVCFFPNLKTAAWLCHILLWLAGLPACVTSDLLATNQGLLPSANVLPLHVFLLVSLVHTDGELHTWHLYPHPAPNSSALRFSPLHIPVFFFQCCAVDFS